jgi:hypothetical protein
MTRAKWMLAAFFLVMAHAGGAMAHSPFAGLMQGIPEPPDETWVEEVLRPWLEKHPRKWKWDDTGYWLRYEGYFSRTVFENDLEALAELPGLTSLDLELHGQQLTDAGMAHIGKLVHLRRLRLSGKNVTDAGAAHLGNLSRLRSLIAVEMSNVTGAGHAFLAELPEMEYFLSMGIGDDGIGFLSSAASLRTVILFGNATVTDAGLAKLASAPKLETLILLHTPNITAGGMAALETFPALTTLWLVDIMDNSVTDQWLAHVARVSGLKTLFLAVAGVTDDGFAPFAGHPALEYLALHCHGLTDACLPAIGAITGLKKLAGHSYDGKITKEGIAELRKMLPECEIVFYLYAGGDWADDDFDWDDEENEE